MEYLEFRDGGRELSSGWVIRADFRKNIHSRNCLKGGLWKKKHLAGGEGNINRHRGRKTKAFVIKIDTNRSGFMVTYVLGFERVGVTLQTDG